MACSEFITTDDHKFEDLKKAEKLGLRVIRPSSTSSLPDEYRQTPLLPGGKPV
jgi:hypothetical protein